MNVPDDLIELLKRRFGDSTFQFKSENEREHLLFYSSVDSEISISIISNNNQGETYSIQIEGEGKRFESDMGKIKGTKYVIPAEVLYANDSMALEDMLNVIDKYKKGLPNKAL
jgi:hypothetical protein